MKKTLSFILVLSMMLSLCTPVLAVSNDSNGDVFYEEFEYYDSLGDKYKGVFLRDAEKSVASIYDEAGNLVVKSEREHDSNIIVETVPKSTESNMRTAISLEDNFETRLVDINDLLVPTDEISANTENISAGAPVTIAATTGDSVPGSTVYKKYGTYNTDYLYMGEILTGDGYYRRTGNYTDSNRVSYQFVRNTAITTISLALGAYYSWLTLTKVKDIIVGLGIGATASALTMDWNFKGCVRAFEYQFKCQMVYNGSSIKVSEITRNLEYLYSEDEVLGTTNYNFDDFSYSSPTQAVNMRCSEAVGYAAKAFSIKYITGSDPSLSLPVNGPVF